MRRAMLMVAVLGAGCGAGTSFDQCETERMNFQCQRSGTTTLVGLNCQTFKNQQCDAAQMQTWLRCIRAAHSSSCTAEGLDPIALAAAENRCTMPRCTPLTPASGDSQK